MHRRKNLGRSALTLSALALLTATGTVSTLRVARADTPQAIKVGIVDESVVGDQYKKLKDTLQRYENRATTLQPQLDARIFMTTDEGQQFDTLILQSIAATPLSAADQTKLDNLVKTGADRHTRYTKLVGQAARSDAEATDMRNLQAIMQGAQVGSERIEDTLLSKIKEQQKTEVDALVSAADDVIKTIAQSKGLTLVLRKDAVIWNAPEVDITKDVLDQLNK